MPDRRWKRRLLIGGIQYRLMVGNFVYLTTIVLAFAIVLFGPILLIFTDQSVPAGQRELAAAQLLALHRRVWFAIPVLIGACLLHSALVAHRVAGPLYRMRRVLGELTAGNLAMHVAVRRHDYLREEAALLARVVGSLDTRVRALRADHRRAVGALAPLVDAVERGAGRDAVVRVRALERQLEELGRHLDQFQLKERDSPADEAGALTPTPPDRVEAVDVALESPQSGGR